MTGHTVAAPLPGQLWPASTPEDARPPVPALRAYRTKGFWVVAAALVVVLGAGASLAVILWPRHPALDFRPLADSTAVTFTPSVPVSSIFSDTAMIGDRAYFASVSDRGVLGVVAADAASGTKLWENPTAGVAKAWDGIVALPAGLAVFARTDPDTDKRRMVILDAERGQMRWQRTIGDNDGVLFSGSVAVLVDRVESRLLALRLSNGTVQWEKRNIKTESGTATAVYAATTADDLSGPAGVSGVAFLPDLAGDRRLVQISADRSARVINAANGEIIGQPRAGVAGTDSPLLVHDGRLIVSELANETARIFTYNLDNLGEPTLLTTVPGGVRVSALTPCGDDRVCWIETTGYDAESTQVAGVRATNGSGGWRTALPGTDTLVPVGDHLLASQNATRSTTMLLDAKGKVTWTANGEAARLDGGNVLLFSKSLSTFTDSPSLAGRHLGDGEQPLGPLDGVRSETCSWNTSVIACVGDKDFRLQRFAGA